MARVPSIAPGSPPETGASSVHEADAECLELLVAGRALRGGHTRHVADDLARCERRGDAVFAEEHGLHDVAVGEHGEHDVADRADLGVAARGGARLYELIDRSLVQVGHHHGATGLQEILHHGLSHDA